MTPTATPTPSLGLRHVALKVRDLDEAAAFYTGVLGYKVDWKPDPDNIYLSSGTDNIALHRDSSALKPALDHIGIVLGSASEVDRWADFLKSRGFSLKKQPRTHRDGSRSFYMEDPAGVLVQFLHHPGLKK